jgi:hypothetical protein
LALAFTFPYYLYVTLTDPGAPHWPLQKPPPQALPSAPLPPGHDGALFIIAHPWQAQIEHLSGLNLPDAENPPETI